jgi:hypothetical protein
MPSLLVVEGEGCLAQCVRPNIIARSTYVDIEVQQSVVGTRQRNFIRPASASFHHSLRRSSYPPCVLANSLHP